MKLKTQKDAFLNYEADNYFKRNKGVKYSAEQDAVIKVLREYKYAPANVLEIGCSTGHRLNAMSELFDGVKTTGIEPSNAAILQGQQDYPQVKFIRGTADHMPMLDSASFNLIIIGFVLYVVDREMLFKVISETDRVLADGGVLMIIDFFSEKPVRNDYQHIQDIDAYAFKQNYEDIFTASKLYHLLDKRSINHATREYDLSGDYYNKYTLTTLRKDLTAGYHSTP
jgi:ubiquinone/menaquinone biosynthesis C-methylase UbiE